MVFCREIWTPSFAGRWGKHAWKAAEICEALGQGIFLILGMAFYPIRHLNMSLISYPLFHAGKEKK